MVRRYHQESVEGRSGIEWIVRWSGVSDGSWTCRFLDWQRDTWFDFITVDAVWHNWIATNVRPRAAHRSDGAVVDNGQARSDLS